MSSNDVYQKVILDHNRNPRFYEIPNDYTHHGVSSNPLCGDHIEVYFTVKEHRLEKVGFQGEGCAVCKSSASLLLSSIQGMPVEKANNYLEGLDDLLDEKNENIERYGELKAFSAMRNFPTRFKCVKLSWSAARAALEE